jgi:ribonuclease E
VNGVPAAAEPSGANGVPTESVAGPAEQPTRRSRPRRRVARSEQGAADTTIETQTAESPEGSSGTRHVARAQVPAEKPAASAAEPLIFGVGVPASEL